MFQVLPVLFYIWSFMRYCPVLVRRSHFLSMKRRKAIFFVTNLLMPSLFVCESNGDEIQVGKRLWLPYSKTTGIISTHGLLLVFFVTLLTKGFTACGMWIGTLWSLELVILLVVHPIQRKKKSCIWVCSPISGTVGGSAVSMCAVLFAQSKPS